ncbi:MAG: helix-turn-helix domain-containing protein [Victivallales bacterium]
MPAEFEKLIRAGESRILELKEKLPSSDAIAKTALAFSNGSGGKIILGINDKSRKTTGLSDDEIADYPDRISNIICDNCSPAVAPEIFSQKIGNSSVLVIEIFPGACAPYYLKSMGRDNGIFIRVGATNRNATREQIQELERRQLNISFDETPLAGSSIDELDMDYLNGLFLRISDRKPSREDLFNLKLAVKSGSSASPTIGGYLLVGKDRQKLPQATVHCARFKGKTTDAFIDRKEYCGYLIELVDEIMNFLKSHIELEGHLEGIRRVDSYSVPLDALREAVVNAIVHRNYSIGGSNIKVAVFDDIVEITSPGSMPGSLSLNDIGTGRSEIRNRTLARMFKESGLIEQWGTGINKMIRLCTERRMKAPEFKEHGNFFQVVFHKSAKRLGGINGGINEGLSKGLNEGLKSLLEIISKSPGLKAPALSRLLEERSPDTVEKQLRSLVQHNLIEHRGSRKAGGYYVKGGINGGLNGGINEGLAEGLSEGLKSLLKEISRNPGSKTPLLSSSLSRPVDTIEKQLGKLLKMKLIERRGSRKTGGYFIK